jgi:L-alanine-DL-glutamate epimerase-like enolase superfamily enzyme
LCRVVRVSSLVLNVSPKTNWFFVSVRDDSGQTAWGEASSNGWETVLHAALERLRPDIEGMPLQEALVKLRPHAQSPGGVFVEQPAGGRGCAGMCDAGGPV